MTLLGNVVRALLGVALGIFGFGLIPIFGTPFVGCDGSLWFTREPGCSNWPEILRGVLLVVPIAILAPRRWMLPVAAVAVLFFASFFGGIEGLKTGYHLSIETIAELYNMFLVSYQNFVGGLVALIVWFIILHRNVTPYNGFNRTPESSRPAKPGESGGGAG